MLCSVSRDAEDSKKSRLVKKRENATDLANARPFVDAITRNQLQLELNEIWKRTGVTLVLVTHSIEEAVFLGHRVLVMSSLPAQIREIVDTSEARDFASPAFADLTSRLHALLIRHKPPLDTLFGSGEVEAHVLEPVAAELSSVE